MEGVSIAEVYISGQEGEIYATMRRWGDGTMDVVIREIWVLGGGGGGKNER